MAFASFFSRRTLLASLLLGLVCASPTMAGEIRVGAAAVKITPPDGIPMAGYYSMRLSDGVLDDLYAKAVVLDDGKTKLAMVVCDLIRTTEAVVAESRRLIAAETGIPADHVMISATHAHTGPELLTGASREKLATGGSPLCRQYIEQLPKWIAQAVAEAYKGRAPASVSFASETADKLAYIRRFWMKDGTVGWNPGIKNPNIIRPIGAVDSEVGVVYAETLGEAQVEKLAADGSRVASQSTRCPLLTYVNFPLHLDTVGGTKISADFPGAMARILAEYKGPEMLTMFANGACGNVNHINVHWAAKQSSPEASRRLGAILAAAVLKAYSELQPVEGVELRVRREAIQLPLAKHTEEELQKAREIAAKDGRGYKFLEIVKAYRILDVEQQKGKPFEAEVQVFTLGRDIAWVALPGEVFVELGLSIKAASPFRQTNIAELSGGVAPYIPNRSAFAEGQYEVVSTRYDVGTGEMLVTTAIRLLNELYQ